MSDLANSGLRKNILGEMPTEGQNSLGHPFPKDLIRDRPTFGDTQFVLVLMRLIRDRDVPFIS